MFFAFLSLAIVGIVLFFTIVAFYNKKNSIKSKDRRSPSADHSTEQNTSGPGEAISLSDQAPNRDYHVVYHKPALTASPHEAPGGASDQKEEGDAYIPVLHFPGVIPGLKKRELVHFSGSGVLYAIDTLSNPGDIDLEQEDMHTTVEGKLVLTSKHIVIYNDEMTKKIPVSSVEKYDFQKSYLIVKRKNVKKKKDIIRIAGKPVEFRYIFLTLI